MINPTHLHVDEIAGISPCNARTSPLKPEARAELKASIAEKGVIQPLLVRREGDSINALDGGSRWGVVRELTDEIDPDDALRVKRVGTVPVVWFEGTDAEAAEASLISFVQRSDLHPVDEFERFVELQEKHGFDAARIARETGKGVRFVQERLRLGRLAPIVRDAWRKGEIEADTAKAFSASESVEAQKAVYKEAKKACALYPSFIGSRLRRDHLGLDSREMKFIGVDAYVAAGGRLDEQIFEEQSYALDAAIARRLVAEKLDAEGERICAEEGWGLYIDEDTADDEFQHDETVDFADEHERFIEINNKYEYQRTPEEQAELEAIYNRAVLRAVPQALRASRAITIKLRWDRVEITRNLVRVSGFAQADDDEDQGEGEFDESSEPRERAKVTPPAPPPEPEGEPLRKGARAVLDETCNHALQNCVQAWPVLALTYAVAAMGCLSRVDAAIDLALHPRRNFKPTHPINIKIADLRFSQALPICAEATNAELMDAFCELVGAAIDTGRLTDFNAGLLLVGVARDYDVRTELLLQFDAQAYFDASTRQAAVEAVRATEGQASANEVAGMKKADAAKRAALVASDFAWLPPTLAEACPPRAAPSEKPRDMRTTAEAMADAIDADEEQQAREHDSFADFLKTFTVQRAGAKIKSKTLYALYLNRMALEGATPLNLSAFGEAIEEHGIAKKRVAQGVFYLDLDLADHVQLAEAAQ
ncbi:ParB family chromosome partitioning protein [Rhodoblastus acidophilus]|uniref:ParB/RepB/Spo0J family partition protein n=1 Tax=Rhodoblastus acidophilus TaxID=1074 RepID=UPI002225B4FA|nr:ParB/RepB/Spo0J family partition protein [Rhodoblastus acidophilus]MCW2315284.1 ParB family chromosome partitioning protein [Rhodoblastus acidophilus]